MSRRGDVKGCSQRAPHQHRGCPPTARLCTATRRRRPTPAPLVSCLQVLPQRLLPVLGGTYQNCNLESTLLAQMVKRLTTMWETWVRSLGREDSLEKEMAPHSSTLAWKIPWTEEPGTVRGVAKSRTRLSDFTFTH